MTQNPFSDQSGVYPRYDPQTGKPLYPGWAGREPEAFSPGDTVFGWLMLLAGYAYWRVFPVTSHPFGGFLLILALFIAAAAALRRRGAGFGLMPCLMAGTALLLSPALFLSANALFHFLVYSYGIAVWCYFVYASCGNALEGGFSSLLPMDFIKAILVQPFASFEKLVSALFGSRGRKQSRLVWKLLIGLLIAVVPAALILALLSYDREFVALFNSEKDPLLQTIAVQGLKLYFTACPFVGFNVILSAYFTSTDFAPPAHAISLLRGFFLIIPMAYLLSGIWGTAGVWCAFPATELIVAIAGAALFLLCRKRLPLRGEAPPERR